MRVDVEYRVPLMVTVDTDSRTVERVRVYDESVDGPRDAYDEAGTSLVGRRQHEAMDARSIAESETWPAWEIG